MATKWGIASCGLIANDFTTALGTHGPGLHEVVACAARSLDSAQQFAATPGIPRPYGEYAAMAADPEVQVVYVAAINPAHLPLARLFIEAGKAVLCEKPLAMNLRETKELVELARARGVFLMEAVWSRCLPAYAALRKELAAGSIGEVKQLIATFGEKIPVGRMHQKELGGGTVLDLGIYTIQLAQLVFGGEEPLVVGAGHQGEDGCDESTSTSLIYSRGRTATLVTHSRVQLPNSAIIVGTKGTITVPRPLWTPLSLETPAGTLEFQLPSGSKHEYNFANSANMAHESAHVRDCLLQGLTESPLVSLEETVVMARIMETVRRQVGVTYPQD
jgi:dihydrodiol dehydrogenase / D-xylose 1-dehydrogenase (NADP)